MNIPRFKEGQRLDAKDLNRILDELERLGRIEVAPPLGIVKEARGILITGPPLAGIFYLKVTTQVPAFSSTATLGLGAGTLCTVSYNSSTNVGIVNDDGPTDQPIYSLGKDAIVVGRYIMGCKVDGAPWHALAEFCR